MLANNLMKFLALAGLALLLAASVSSGQAKGNKDDGEKKSAAKHDGAKSNTSAMPKIDEHFKELLDKVIDDKELTKTIAQYMEIAPSSHKSRSLVTDFLQSFWQHVQKNNNDTKVANPTSPPKRPKNPIKDVVKIISEMGKCEGTEECSDLVCNLLRPKKKVERKQNRVDSPLNKCPGRCPVPDFCPFDECKYCPPKPVCPCGEPKGVFIPDPNRPNMASTTSKPANQSSYSLWEPSKRLRRIFGDHSPPKLGNNPVHGHRTTSKKPCSGKDCSTTTTKKSFTSPTGHVDLLPPLPSSTTSKPASTTTMRATGSSSMMPNPSTTTTTLKPRTSSTKRSGGKVIKEKTSNSSSSKLEVTDSEGKKSVIMGENSTVSNLEYLQLENGLKVLIKNRTVVKIITDAVNALPFRAGGLEGKLAGEILAHFGEDTSRWQVPGRKPGDRGLTYSTLRRNQLHIVSHIVAAIIKKNCKHCVEKCKNSFEESGFPIDEPACSGHTTTARPATSSAPHLTTKEPKSISHRPIKCEPCWSGQQTCPAPPGCMQYTCPYPSYQCKKMTTTTARPSSSTLRPSGSPSSSTGKPPSSSSTMRPSGSSSTMKPPAVSTTPKMNPKARHDPDFPPDFPHDSWSAQRMSDPDFDQTDLDDIDLDNQLREEERFKEIPCRGAICADQRHCGLAELNELTPKKKESGYIVNGTKQKYGEWPSYAKLSINLSGSDSGSQYDKSLCGGVLISKKHVLTAGHCVRFPKTHDNQVELGEKLKPEAFEVTLGEHDRVKKDKFETQHKVQKICFSSKFNDPHGEGSRFDFAVLTLKDEAKFNDHIQPACLPYKPFPLGRSKCFVVGQGKTRDEHGGSLIQSQVVRKMPVSRGECRGWGFNELDRSRWCFTKSKGNGDSCNGDSGGPILCRGKDHKWHIMGLVSYGTEECDGQSPGWVAVYTRIPGILKQIHEDCFKED